MSTPVAELVLVALLALILGYVLAMLVGRKAQARTEAQLSAAAAQLALVQAQIQHHSAQSLQQQAEITRLRDSLHSAEQVCVRQAAELQGVSERRGELTRALEHLQQRCDAAEQAGHASAAISQTARAELAESRKQYTELKDSWQQLQTRYEQLQAEHSAQGRELAELKTSLAERDASHTRQLAQFDAQKQALSEQFKVLANDILDSKTKALQESSQVSLAAVMNPFQQSIEIFKKEVQDIHHRETTQQGELRKELETLKQLNQQITTEAHHLSTALRGQKKLQGNWGELVLENVLDRSGLQLGKDYQREVSVTTEDGRWRPDAVVYLPQGKHLIIDAKVSLNAYTRYINSEDEAERKLALAEHVSAVRSRIRELANKDYYKLPGLNSPDMVFMFVPIESAFVEALKADESLFQMAIENHVLVATPTTLLTSLNIVRQLWRYEDQNKHTAALASKADAVFKKLNGFLVSFEGVKRGLEKAADAYSKAENQLVSGKGNLVKQVGDFRNLAPAIKAELPAYFTERADLEIDYLPGSPPPEDA
jgi:DNA recombination protein RmuC